MPKKPRKNARGITNLEFFFEVGGVKKESAAVGFLTIAAAHEESGDQRAKGASERRGLATPLGTRTLLASIR